MDIFFPFCFFSPVCNKQNLDDGKILMTQIFRCVFQLSSPPQPKDFFHQKLINNFQLNGFIFRARITMVNIFNYKFSSLDQIEVVTHPPPK
jgi:hypothetical protein